MLFAEYFPSFFFRNSNSAEHKSVCFAKTVKAFKSLIILAQSSIIDVWTGLKCACGISELLLLNFFPGVLIMEDSSQGTNEAMEIDSDDDDDHEPRNIRMKITEFINGTVDSCKYFWLNS